MPEFILVADDEQTVSTFVKKIIEYDKSNNAEVHIANDVKSFNTYLSENKYSAIIIDLNFGNQNVTDFISKYSSEHPLVPIIAMSANISVDIAINAIRSGAYDFISKPFTSETIVLVVKNALERRQLISEKEKLNKDLSEVNDELIEANKMITKQKEQLDNYLNNILEGIEKIKDVSVAVGRVKSFETNLNLLFDKLNEIYSPEASVLLIYEKDTGKFTVKKENNYGDSFSEGVEISESVFEKYFSKGSISIDEEMNNRENTYTVILPLKSGSLNLGIILFDIEIEKIRDSDKVFFEILRYLITISILNSKFLEDSRKSYLESLFAFLLLEEKTHSGIKKHSERVASVCVKIGKHLKLPDSDIRNLQYAGLLHLLGLITVSRAELTKENYFKPDDSNIIKNALLEGTKILIPLKFLNEAREVIESIYENYDGSGMPGKLSGDSISISSRILRVAGEFFAFRNIFKMEMKDIREYMDSNKGKLYDPDIVKLFFDIIIKH